MSDGQVLWLNVTNVLLGLLVILPVIALAIALFVELFRRAGAHGHLHGWHPLHWHGTAHVRHRW